MSWENLMKDQNIFSVVIILLILITFLLDCLLIFLGENWCWSLSGLKPGSHMPPMYLRRSRWYRLGHFSDEWEHGPPATWATAKLYRRHTWVNFAGMPGVKTGMSNVAGHFCSHIWTVSPAVPAAISQVHRRHIRTSLNYGEHKWKLCIQDLHGMTLLPIPYVKQEISSASLMLMPRVFCFVCG